MLRTEFIRNFCIEERNHRRIPVALDIEYWPIKGLKSRPGRVNEIGMDGFLLYLPEYLEIGQELRISVLCDLASEFKLVEPQVQVVWNERPLKGSGQWFHCGARIINISALDYHILVCFLLILRNKIGSIGASKPFDHLP